MTSSPSDLHLINCVQVRVYSHQTTSTCSKEQITHRYLTLLFWRVIETQNYYKIEIVFTKDVDEAFGVPSSMSSSSPL